MGRLRRHHEPCSRIGEFVSSTVLALTFFSRFSLGKVHVAARKRTLKAMITGNCVIEDAASNICGLPIPGVVGWRALAPRRRHTSSSLPSCPRGLASIPGELLIDSEAS